MNKLLAKLLVCVAALAMSASLMVVSTYAWLTMSGAPEVDGIQIHIGGSNTVLIAADMTVQNEDGTVSHYPGEFKETLSFSENSGYDYLNSLSGLLPVSTADGIHWFLPDYYDLTDPLVQSGQFANGQMKDITEFLVDDDLSAANLTELGSTDRGHYIYLDFWVVSPGADYLLRISSADDGTDNGSYVIELPNLEKQGDSFVLKEDTGNAGTSVRLGFLVNNDTTTDQDLLSYISSSAYSSRYTRLQGRYIEPGQSLQEIQAENNRFTIYEPNGDLHADGSGEYHITKPLSFINGTITPANISDRLTVQLKNDWRLAENTMQTMLQQQFATAIVGKDISTETEVSLWRYFYQERLQGQLAHYVDRGSFVTNTLSLYKAAQYGKIGAEDENLRLTSNATEDVDITILERDVPQRIRMFIWLEGQDQDCVNSIETSGFSVSLELAGSNDY